jgi:diadenosine tetraphosphate (Ap4A) HIT family hydrolase
MFTLHPQLQMDTHFVTDLRLSSLLLMNDSNYPWLILVPRVDGMRDLVDLNEADQKELLREINLASHALKNLHQVEKLNIASLGNMVPQLHVHIVARFKTDPAWPKPVWGQVAAKPYDDPQPILQKLKSALSTQ